MAIGKTHVLLNISTGMKKMTATIEVMILFNIFISPVVLIFYQVRQSAFFLNKNSQLPYQRLRLSYPAKECL
jgi:hypothetical protein